MNENDILAQLLQLSQQTGQQRTDQQNFAQRLRDERMAAVQKINQAAAPTFTGQTAVPTDPIGRFDREQAFLEAGKGILSPYIDAQGRADELAAQEQNLLTNLLKMGVTSTDGQATVAGGDTLDDLLKRRKALSDQGLNTSQIDAQLEAAGYGKTSGETMDLTSQINSLSTAGERNGARATKDILDVVDSAITNFRSNVKEGTGTGPLSALGAGFSKLTTPNATAKLQKDLKEILRTVRKESTGVAFSPQEIKELENEIPTILQQEGNVEDSLIRLKQRMLQKLTNYGLDVSNEMNSIQSQGIVRMQSPDGQVYEVDSSEASEAEENGWKRI